MTAYASNFIYQAAKKQSLEQLKKVLTHASIDTFDAGSYRHPAITRLAQENNKKAVTFLLQHGAQPAFAIYGIAMSDNQQWLTDMLSKHPDLTDFAAQGAGFAGNPSLSEMLLQQGANKTAVILGAALGQHFDWVDNLLSKPPHPHEATAAAVGAAVNNNWDRMRKYQVLGGNVCVIAKAIGIAGHWHQGQILLEQNKQHPNLAEYLAIGFAMGGHSEKSMRLHHTAHVPMTRILYGAACRGDKSWCQSIMRTTKINVDHLLYGAAHGGQLHWCESLRSHQEDFFDTTFTERDNTIAESARLGGFRQYADRLAPPSAPKKAVEKQRFFKKPPETVTDHNSDTDTFTLESSSISSFTLSEI